MEITVKIDGRDVRFKKTGGTMKRYKTMFGREWFADLDKIGRMQRKAEQEIKNAGIIADDKSKKRSKKSDKLTEDEIFTLSSIIAQYDSDPYYNILYIMAKEADSTIPDTVEDWLDTFEEFEFIEVFNQVSPMLSRELKTDAKNVSAAAEPEAVPAG